MWIWLRREVEIQEKEVTVGKDLLGIKRIENSQNICTALLGYVKKDNGEFITISEINNGVPYLVDDATYQRWNEKGKHKFAFLYSANRKRRYVSTATYDSHENGNE